MKLKDLTPGMEVAVGNPLDRVKSYCHRAIVVGVGWKRTKWYGGISYSWRITNEPDDRGVAVATVSVGNDGTEYWFPHVYPPSHIMQTWADYLKRVELDGTAAKQREEERKKAEEGRNSLMAEVAELTGIKAHFYNGSLCIDEADIPKLLAKLKEE